MKRLAVSDTIGNAVKCLIRSIYPTHLPHSPCCTRLVCWSPCCFHVALAQSSTRTLFIFLLYLSFCYWCMFARVRLLLRRYALRWFAQPPSPATRLHQLPYNGACFHMFAASAHCCCAVAVLAISELAGPLQGPVAFRGQLGTRAVHAARMLCLLVFVFSNACSQWLFQLLVMLTLECLRTWSPHNSVVRVTCAASAAAVELSCLMQFCYAPWYCNAQVRVAQQALNLRHPGDRLQAPQVCLFSSVCLFEAANR